jgi:hypothetical protein
MPQLIAQDGTQYPITGSVTTIGRENCDIILPQDSLISRRHAKIERHGGNLVISDMDSSNGTFVNGSRLQAPHTLQTGDTIRVGSTSLTVQGAGGAPPTRMINEQPQFTPSPPAQYQAPQTPHPGQATKDKTLAYVLEFLLLGVGWLYAGETTTGIIILVSWVVFGLGFGILLNVVTAGWGCICTLPLTIVAYAISLTQLGKYMNNRPNIFQ